MAAALIGSPKPTKDDKFNHVIGENYELALSESIQALLDSKNRDFSAFASTFYELMQTRDNPPLESIWFYSALTYRCNHKNSPGDEPSRVSATKDLFQLISSCSASSSSSRSIGLLAPVIYEAYRVLVDLKSGDLSSKRERKIIKDIKSLVDAILGFISVCCSANDGGLVPNSDGFFQPLEDLIRIWIGEASEGKEKFELFFPILGDDIVGRLREEGTVVGELAGAVIAEAFLLKLCLYFCSGGSKQELQKEPRAWAVSSITGFRNFYFFETLVGMLLEPSLPVTSILSSEDEVSLRNVLYDAIVLVEYSFFNFDEMSHLPNKRVIRLAIARVIVTHEATESFRVKGDQTKAISYINAFSGSELPIQLVKLVISEIGMDSKASQPKAWSPKAVLKWLLNLEDQGFRVLEDSIRKCYPRLTLDISESEHDKLAYDMKEKRTDDDLLFYVDNKGEGEDGSEDDERQKESASVAFLAAAHIMASEENGGGRKRKGGRSSEKKKNVKFQKYNLYSNSGSLGGDSTFLEDDGSSSGSEVENPISDEDTEERRNEDL